MEYTEDGGESWTEIKRGTLVSMNLFGFTEGFMKEVEAGFPEALTRILSGDRPEVVKAMAEKTAAGLYPEKLW